eukprot:1184392-Prorocentrum_minimum.AAC.4
MKLVSRARSRGDVRGTSISVPGWLERHQLRNLHREIQQGFVATLGSYQTEPHGGAILHHRYGHVHLGQPGQPTDAGQVEGTSPEVIQLLGGHFVDGTGAGCRRKHKHSPVTQQLVHVLRDGVPNGIRAVNLLRRNLAGHFKAILYPGTEVWLVLCDPLPMRGPHLARLEYPEVRPPGRQGSDDSAVSRSDGCFHRLSNQVCDLFERAAVHSRERVVDGLPNRLVRELEGVCGDQPTTDGALPTVAVQEHRAHSPQQLHVPGEPPYSVERVCQVPPAGVIHPTVRWSDAAEATVTGGHSDGSPGVAPQREIAQLLSHRRCRSR